MTSKTEHQIADAEQVLDLLKELNRKGIKVINFESSNDGAKPFIFVERTQELDLYMMDRKVSEIKEKAIHLHTKYTHQMGCTISWEMEELWQTRAWQLYTSDDKPGVALVAQLLKGEGFGINSSALVRYLSGRAF